MRLIIVPAALAFVIDQVSKYAVVFGLNLEQRLLIEVLPPILVFKMGWNTGINFGLFDNDTEVMRWILIGLAVVISAWLLIWARRGLTRPIALISVGLIIGGAFGNAIDRILHGAVMDFLNMSCCGIRNPFSFNLADVAIFAGAIGIIFFSDPPRGATEKTP